jgi:hypothetical protein
MNEIKNALLELRYSDEEDKDLFIIPSLMVHGFNNNLGFRIN